ncbi:MAG TPA: DUF2071 domain-containing protein [Thermoanaerobaculia bacterium]|nr:DUF2071 domain-containing protein [Thermoanaerobaculia bacterium]
MILSAPVGAMEGRRRPRRPWHVLVTLEDLLIVTWAPPEDALARLLPRDLVPWSRDGRGRLSAVLFRNRALRPAFPGLPRLGCFQMNLRTYVLDPVTGRPGAVFFHGLYLSTAWLSAFSSALFRVPFRWLPLRLSGRRDGAARRWEALSEDGSVAIVAQGETDSLGAPDAEMLDVLTNPHTGFVPDSRGRLLTWSLWHRNQSPRVMRVESLRIAQLERIGLPLGPPVSALLVDAVDYEVYLPARRLRSVIG